MTALTYRERGQFSKAELIRRGYAAATKAASKTFELPDFVPADDYRYLPLVIQVRYQDTVTTYPSVGEQVHLRKFFAN